MFNDNVHCGLKQTHMQTSTELHNFVSLHNDVIMQHYLITVSILPSLVCNIAFVLVDKCPYRARRMLMLKVFHGTIPSLYIFVPLICTSKDVFKSDIKQKEGSEFNITAL